MAVIREHVHEVIDPATVVIPLAESEGEITAHEAAANPHPTYETSAEAAAKITAHEAAANPHAGYFVPPSIPEIPATPTAQDIVDALVTLGLVTQAAP